MGEDFISPQAKKVVIGWIFLMAGTKFVSPWAEEVMFGWIDFTFFFSSMIHGDPTC